jgi:hypothetical protein
VAPATRRQATRGHQRGPVQLTLTGQTQKTLHDLGISFSNNHTRDRPRSAAPARARHLKNPTPWSHSLRKSEADGTSIRPADPHRTRRSSQRSSPTRCRSAGSWNAPFVSPGCSLHPAQSPATSWTGHSRPGGHACSRHGFTPKRAASVAKVCRSTCQLRSGRPARRHTR